MLHICCQVKHCLSISQLGIILRSQSPGNDKNFSAHINRALTRLKSSTICTMPSDKHRYKQANHFYHPIENSASDQYGIGDERQFQVQSAVNCILNTLLILSVNHCLSFVKLLDIRSKCLVDGIERQNILLDLIWKKCLEQVSQACQQKVVI